MQIQKKRETEEFFMKSNKVVLMSAVVVTLTSLHGWNVSKNGEHTAKHPAPDETIAERNIASLNEFSAAQKIGLAVAPRMTAIMKAREMAREMEEQRQDYLGQINKLESQLKQEVNQNDDLQVEIVQLNKKLEDLSVLAGETISDLYKERGQLIADKNELEKSLKAKIQERQERLEELQLVAGETVHNLNKEKADLKERIEELQLLAGETVHNLNKEKADLKERIEELQLLAGETIHNLQQDHAQELKEKQERLEELQLLAGETIHNLQQDHAQELKEKQERLEELQLLAGEAVHNLNQEKKALEQELKDLFISKQSLEDEVEAALKQLKLAQSEVKSLEQQLETAIAQKEEQKEIISELEYIQCRQNERISGLEQTLQEKLEEKENALKRILALESKEIKEEKSESVVKIEKVAKNQESEINLDDLIQAFKGMIQSQINFQQQYSQIDQLNRMPMGLGMDYSPFLMQNMMNQQLQMKHSMPMPSVGGYWQPSYGTHFLNTPFLDDINLQSYYGTPSLPHYQQGRTPALQGFGGHHNQMDHARYNLFPQLERMPAQGGYQAPHQSQRPLTNVETFQFGNGIPRSIQ